MAEFPTIESMAAEVKAEAIKMIEQQTGVSFERLVELAIADREERCVVMPCKQGDTVWRICGPKGRKFVAERKVVSVTMYQPGRFEIFTNCDDWLGETVFLTREEAESKLKEREQNA